MKTEDNRTRAEKIAKVLASLLNYEPRLADPNYKSFVEELCGSLDKAVEEANFQKEQEMVFIKQEYGELGFAAAREKAAKEAEDHIECVNYTKRDCPERIAERIRAMEPDK